VLHRCAQCFKVALILPLQIRMLTRNPNARANKAIIIQFNSGKKIDSTTKERHSSHDGGTHLLLNKKLPCRKYL